MPSYRITPLAPAYTLLLGAALMLVIGPVLSPRRRRLLAVVVSGLAVLSLFLVGSGYPADVDLARTLIEWLGEPALAVRVPPFEPFLWLLILSLLAISLAEQGVGNRSPALDDATLLGLAAVACGVVLAGNFRTLAFALLLFDGAAALFALGAGRSEQAIGRLLLGVLSSATVMALAQGRDYLTAHPSELGALFSLTVWLRLGLYPLVESNASAPSSPLMRLGWHLVNWIAGLYLAVAGVAPWLVWLAGVTTVLYGGLAWLEPKPDRALIHTGHALVGGILTMTAAVGGGLSAVAASIGTLAALVALQLTPAWLGRPDWSRPGRLWTYLPPLLATAALIGVPFTLGWGGRGALYQATWGAGMPGTLAVVVVAEGAALSALYHYWRRLLHGPAPAGTECAVFEEGETSERDTAPEKDEILTQGAGSPTPTGTSQGKTKAAPADSETWRSLGATLVSVPFLTPVLGPRLLLLAAPPSAAAGSGWGSFAWTASLGLVGSLLWAFFLGYGRSRLLDAIPFSRHGLMSVLRLGWLLRSLMGVLDTTARLLLRVRAVIEGEHYLAWAILLALGLVLIIMLR